MTVTFLTRRNYPSAANEICVEEPCVISTEIPVGLRSMRKTIESFDC